jgi:peptidyl-prolyl cis-trans isomerase B (cyclophilin B)
MKAILNTNHGAIEIELNEEKAPVTVANFVSYVKSGHYDGTIFHRVIDGFMIQGGGFDKNMRQKSTQKEIKNEANNGLKNDKYTIAMARTMQPHSATSQFFINVKDNDFLNFKAEDLHGWGYAVFGKVVDGTDIVDKIKAVKTGRHGVHDDVPLEAVVIESATIEQE